jgi:hypothetical protein
MRLHVRVLRRAGRCKLSEHPTTRRLLGWQQRTVVDRLEVRKVLPGVELLTMQCPSLDHLMSCIGVLQWLLVFRHVVARSAFWLAGILLWTGGG